MYSKKVKKMKGGIPIYPGGYSCVFKPQLNCKSKNKTKKNIKQKKRNNTTNDAGISKLLFKKYADIEMHNIEKFYYALRKIPKSHKYFLFAKTTSCNPAKIPIRELKGFDEMCTNFTSHGVNETNINSVKNIRSLRLINMPNAGISVNEWLFMKNKTTNVTIPLTLYRIKTFNKIISKLILNAIVPMNQKGVIHNDMKEDNILIKDPSTSFYTETKLKSLQPMPIPTIIDWGISGISTRDEPIPEIIMNRYISISNPFSSILFTTEFSKNYSEFLKQNEINTPSDVDSMRYNDLFMEKLHNFSITQYLKNKDHGHYSHIRKFFTEISKLFPNVFSNFSLDSSSSSDELYHTIVSKYISDILLHYTKFDERDKVVRFQYVTYFRKVYIFNCDIWGTMFCYSVFFNFQDTHESKNKYDKYIDIDTSTYSHFLHSILSMYMNEVMVNGHEKINIPKLSRSILELI